MKTMVDVMDELDNLRDGVKAIGCIADALAQNQEEYFCRALFFVNESMETRINFIEEVIDEISRLQNFKC